MKELLGEENGLAFDTVTESPCDHHAYSFGMETERHAASSTTRCTKLVVGVIFIVAITAIAAAFSSPLYVEIHGIRKVKLYGEKNGAPVETMTCESNSPQREFILNLHRGRPSGLIIPPHHSFAKISVELSVNKSEGFQRDEAAQAAFYVSANNFNEHGSAWTHMRVKVHESHILAIARRSLDSAGRGPRLQSSAKSTAPTHTKGIVIDIGANSGIYGLLGASHGFESHMFEPHPACASDILYAVSRNRFCGRAFLHPVAVSTHKTTFHMRTDMLCRRSGPLLSPNATRNHILFGGMFLKSVQSVRLDDAIAGIARERGQYAFAAEILRLSHRGASRRGGIVHSGLPRAASPTAAKPFHVAFAKIDVDGHEPAVLLGALGTLRADVVANMVLKATPLRWAQFGFTMGQAAAIISLMCAEGNYYASVVSPFKRFGTREVLEVADDGDFAGGPPTNAAVQMRHALEHGFHDMPPQFNMWFSKQPTDVTVLGGPHVLCVD
eukprot:Opistho-2@13263